MDGVDHQEALIQRQREEQNNGRYVDPLIGPGSLKSTPARCKHKRNGWGNVLMLATTDVRWEDRR